MSSSEWIAEFVRFAPLVCYSKILQRQSTKCSDSFLTNFLANPVHTFKYKNENTLSVQFSALNSLE